MKKIALSVLSILCVLWISPGCMTSVTASNISKQKYMQLEPQSVWIQAPDKIAISGYRYTSYGNQRDCYIVLPISSLDKLKNEKGIVTLNQIGSSFKDDLSEVQVIDGQVPSSFKSVVKKELTGKSLYADKGTEFSPGAVVALPFAIVFDALTFPIQIKVMKDFENVH